MTSTGAPDLVTPPVDWLAVAPSLALFAAAVVIVMVRSLMRRNPRVFGIAVALSYAGLLASAVSIVVQWRVVDRDGPYQALAGMVAVDGFAVFVQAVVLIQQRCRMPREVIERLTTVKLISQTGRRTTHIDVEACTAAGVIVCNQTGR